MVKRNDRDRKVGRETEREGEDEKYNTHTQNNSKTKYRINSLHKLIQMIYFVSILWFIVSVFYFCFKFIFKKKWWSLHIIQTQYHRASEFGTNTELFWPSHILKYIMCVAVCRYWIFFKFKIVIFHNTL